jgi:hypothetical protein
MRLPSYALTDEASPRPACASGRQAQEDLVACNRPDAADLFEQELDAALERIAA